MLLSIIVPCFCSKYELLSFLKAFSDTTIQAHEIELIVVDDASPDDLKETFDSFRFRPPIAAARYLRNARNSGRAATRNAGIRQAKGEIIFMIDVDNLPSPSFLANIMARFQSAGDIHGLAVRGHTNVDAGWRRRSLYARYHHTRFLGNRKPGAVANLDMADLPPRFFATGSIAVSKANLDRAGLFDENFKYYGCEDEDLGIRLWKLGVKIHYANNAVVVDNDGNSNLSGITTKMEEYARHSLPLLLAKHPDYIGSTIIPELEMTYRHLGLPGKFKKLAMTLLLRPALGNLLKTFLIAIDGLAPRNATLAMAFQIMIGCYYNKGRLSRPSMP